MLFILYFIVGQHIISLSCLKDQFWTQALETQMLEKNTWGLSFVQKDKVY